LCAKPAGLGETLRPILNRTRWRVEGWPEAQMPNTPAKLAEHYRKLAAEEVAMAKLALTNEARARHYGKAADY
jgi:hypothetical protein